MTPRTLSPLRSLSTLHTPLLVSRDGPDSWPAWPWHECERLPWCVACRYTIYISQVSTYQNQSTQNYRPAIIQYNDVQNQMDNQAIPLAIEEFTGKQIYYNIMLNSLYSLLWVILKTESFHFYKTRPDQTRQERDFSFEWLYIIPGLGTWAMSRL